MKGTIIKQSDGWLLVKENLGYGMRAKEFRTATTQVVVLEWTHPNYGYWADAAVFVRGLHSIRKIEGWKELWFVNWNDESKADARELRSHFQELGIEEIFSEGNLVCLDDDNEVTHCGVTGSAVHSKDCKYLGNDLWDCGAIDNPTPWPSDTN